MVFQGEEVALSKDILKKPILFVKNWLEWVADNEIQVLENVIGVTTPTVIFTVPDKQTLFITTCFLDNIYTGDVGAAISPNLSIQGTGKVLIASVVNIGDATHIFGSLSFPMPIKVEEKQSIRVTSGANNRVSAGFSGFLVKKKIT